MTTKRGILLVAAVLLTCAVMQAGATGSGEDLSMTVWIQKTFVPEANEALKQRGMGLRVTEGGKRLLAEEGYDPAYGARPLRRAIQR